MAATSLEDEMGWAKKDNYCSSSEDENENEHSRANVEVPYEQSTPRKYSSGPTCNTGPKGVLEDWRQYKKLESERRAEREKELVALAKRVSMTCRTHREDELAKKAEEAQEKSDDDDDFLNEYAAKRMREMVQMYQAKKNPVFGTVYELTDADMYVDAIDEDSKSSTVVLHLYENKVKNCEIFDRCLAKLAERYPMIKCCRVRASLVGASERLQSIGLPAVLAYRNGQLIGNFIRIGDELDDDFDVGNVEQYLKVYGILPDMSDWNASSLQANNTKPDSRIDSDSDSD